MSTYNLKNQLSIEDNYAVGLLPQRNSKDSFYSDTSSRANLSQFTFSSENRRILRKTENFSFERIPMSDFTFTLETQKTIFRWIKTLGWDFPISSVKKIFTDHIFNYLYIWKDENQNIIAYSVCYFSENISHIAYVFYDPQYAHGNLPIRLVLQTVTDSYDLGLNYCYLGRFSPNSGFYKRNMPGFEYFDNGTWIKYNKLNQ